MCPLREDLSASCGRCHVRELCLPRGLSDEDLAQLDRQVRHRVVQRKEILYRAGDAFDFLYVVRSGSVKVSLGDSSGAEQVIGFQLAGELLGLDALYDQRHRGTAQALETTSICEIGFDHLESLCAKLPSLNRQVERLMGKELGVEQELMLSLARRGVEQRVAVFLLDLSRRWKERGFSSRRFTLSMSREEIASYLGTAAETVSRAFVELRETGVLGVHKKNIEILDLDALIQRSGTPEIYGRVFAR